MDERIERMREKIKELYDIAFEEGVKILNEPESNTTITQTNNFVVGTVDYETEKAYKIRRSDGLIAWVAKSHVAAKMVDKLIILEGHEWILDNMDWKVDVQKSR